MLMAKALVRFVVTAAVTIALHPTSAPAPTRAAPPGPGNWVDIFGDDFTGAQLDRSQWVTCTGNVLGKGCAGGGGEIGIKLPDGVAQQNGALQLIARKRDVTDAYGVVHNYTSGVISARNRFAFTYGYVEARINVPRGRGFWTGVYLLPVDPRYPAPEIDIVEVLGNDTTLGYLTQHYASPTGQDATYQGEVRGIDFAEGWHTVAVDWQPGLIIWYVDGVERFRSTQNVPDEPMYPLIELSIGTTWNGNDQPDASVAFPNALEADYIRVWQRGQDGFWQRGEALLRNTSQDEIESFDRMHARTDNLTLVTDAPLDYLGDVSRVTRTSNNAASMTWRYPNIGRVDARAFFTPGEPIQPFVFSASPDGVAFTPLTALPFGFTAARPWIDYVIRDVPQGTNFVKVDFPSGLPRAASAELAAISFEPAFDVIDGLETLTRTVNADGVSVVGADPASFGGDSSRLARTGTARAGATWRHQGLTQARIVAWHPAGQALQPLTVEVSSDGASFKPVSATIQYRGAPAAGAWRRVDYLVNAPPCAHYLRATLAEGAASPQIGSVSLLAAAPTKIDDFYWFGSADNVSDGVRFLNDAPASFDGDVSRFARLGTATAFVDWRMPNVREVRALAYHSPQHPVLAPKFYASADGAQFVALTATQTLTPGNWTQARYVSAVPACMSIVRIEIPAGGVDGYDTQIARLTYRAEIPALLAQPALRYFLPAVRR
jgi:beta-glucanase (GH16 family)